MVDACRKLIKEINDPDFRHELEQNSKDALNLAWTIESGDLEGYEDLRENWEGCIEFALNVHNPTTLFRKIIESLQPPAIITANEVIDGFLPYLEADQPPGTNRLYNEFDLTYDGFVDHINLRVLKARHIDAIPLCEIWGLTDQPNPYLPWMLKCKEEMVRAELIGRSPELPPPPNEPVAADTRYSNTLEIWSANGFSLTVVGVNTHRRVLGKDAQQAPSTSGKLVATLRGRASDGAMRALVEELLPCIHSLLRSASLTTDGQIISNGPLPHIRAENFVKCHAFISTCASSLFVEAPKKEMKRRFANAARLLAAADDQRSDAIQLALSVAAMEALLVTKRDTIHTALSKRIAILFEPGPNHRPKAEEFVQELYDLRSQTLHGEATIARPSARIEARTLAGACLYCLWSRDDSRRKLGEPADTLDDLLRDLREAEWPDGLPEHVHEQFPQIQKLWRDRTSAS